MAGTVWNVYAPLTKIKASKINENFDWLEGSLVPQTAGNQTTGAYDLGSSSYRWRTAYFGGATTSVQMANGSFLYGLNSVASPSKLIGRATTDYLEIGDLAFGNLVRIFGGTGGLNIELSTTVASFNLSGTALEFGVRVNEFSNDVTLADNSDRAVPTEKAVKTYVANTGHAVATLALNGSVLTTAAMTITIPFNVVVEDPAGEMTSTGSYFTTANSTTCHFMMHINVGSNTSTSNKFVLSLDINSSTVAAFFGWSVPNELQSYTFQYSGILQPSAVVRVGFSAATVLYLNGTTGPISSTSTRCLFQVIRT